MFCARGTNEKKVWVPNKLQCICIHKKTLSHEQAHSHNHLVLISGRKYVINNGKAISTMHANDYILIVCAHFSLSLFLYLLYASEHLAGDDFFPGRSLSSLSFMHLLSHSIDYNTFIVLSFHRIIFVASFGFEIWPKYGCLDVYEPCSKMSIVEMVRLGECFEQNVDYFVETFRNRHLFNHFICILDSEYKLNSYRKRFPQISIAT